MSDPYGQKKIHVEKLMEDAWEWWQSLEEFQQEDHILKSYMREKKIGEEEVEY